MTVTRLSAMDLRHNIGDMTSRVLYAGERFIIEKRGKPVMAIVSIEDLERLEQLEEERELELMQLAKIAAERKGMANDEEVLALYERMYNERLELPERV